MGRATRAINPTTTVTIEMTAAKTGRRMKKRLNMMGGSLRRYLADGQFVCSCWRVGLTTIPARAF